ncbi:hypothetical protein CO046_00230 [Candidatus Peregrinibacteria bacterium CG_4_9_14_0_2_um_filter_53_11]|nr:MAG: hypothetical protein CO046_00230 [Candidatus Peregrinibacteria bacterium CG_4_9_14_0_2_um_filter_53_11]
MSESSRESLGTLTITVPEDLEAEAGFDTGWTQWDDQIELATAPAIFSTPNGSDKGVLTHLPTGFLLDLSLIRRLAQGTEAHQGAPGLALYNRATTLEGALSKLDQFASNQGASAAHMVEAGRRIISGPFNCVLLVDSYGGSRQVAEGIAAMSSLARASGGTAASFAGDVAMSGGANLLLAADPDRRYVGEGTALMWHIAHAGDRMEELEALLDDEGRAHLRASTRAEWSELSARLIDAARREQRDLVQAVITQTVGENPDDLFAREIALSGGDAIAFGIAKKVGPTTDITTFTHGQLRVPKGAEEAFQETRAAAFLGNLRENEDMAALLALLT